MVALLCWNNEGNTSKTGAPFNGETIIAHDPIFQLLQRIIFWSFLLVATFWSQVATASFFFQYRAAQDFTAIYWDNYIFLPRYLVVWPCHRDNPDKVKSLVSGNHLTSFSG